MVLKSETNVLILPANQNLVVTMSEEARSDILKQHAKEFRQASARDNLNCLQCSLMLRLLARYAYHVQDIQ